MKYRAASFVTICLLVLAYPAYKAWYQWAGGEPGEEARYFVAQHARQTDPKERCADAALAAGFYGRAGMRDKYDEWNAKVKEDCPGPYPYLPYRPDKDAE